MPHVKLYRTISQAELLDIQATGRLRPALSSVQGKWFAERPEHAAAWGRAFEPATGVPHSHIIEVRFEVELADRLFRLTSLDNIGPARFATIEQLAEVVEVSLWPNVQF